MDNIRAIVIPNECPLPANSGGRIDVWRKINLLSDIKVELALLSWYDLPRNGELKKSVLNKINNVCETSNFSPITRNFEEIIHRLWWTGRLPSHAAARWVSLDRSKILEWVHNFKPTVILLDGLYGAAVACWLSSELGIPFVYRSHNIEHQYMKMQYMQTKSIFTRVGLFLNMFGLRRMENSIIGQAASVLDISPHDADYWRSKGFKNIVWMPTLVDDAFCEALMKSSNEAAEWDALYFGNLNTPNNVEAIRWLVTEVLPKVGVPGFKVAIAGSRPSSEVISIVRQDNRINLLPDPVDMAAVVGRARVLLNPVHGGSGVNLKSVEMLFSQAWLVSTPMGVHGLPSEAAACFSVHENASDFATAIESALARPAPDSEVLESRREASKVFSASGVAPILKFALQNRVIS